jgi:predicted aspartyl protease
MTPGPYPSVAIRFSIDGVTREVSALIDTGFDGHLAVPAALSSAFPVPAFRQRVRTASGQVVAAPAFDGTVELTDVPGAFPVLVIALGDEFLLGLSSVNYFRVTLDHGQQVIIER